MACRSRWVAVLGVSEACSRRPRGGLASEAPWGRPGRLACSPARPGACLVGRSLFGEVVSLLGGGGDGCLEQVEVVRGYEGRLLVPGLDCMTAHVVGFLAWFLHGAGSKRAGVSSNDAGGVICCARRLARALRPCSSQAAVAAPGGRVLLRRSARCRARERPGCAARAAVSYLNAQHVYCVLSPEGCGMLLGVNSGSSERGVTVPGCDPDVS